jgi:2-keto-4-pentenoate hydratase
MTPTDLIPIAHQIKSAQDEVRQITPLSAQHSDFDVASAYAVAELIHRERVAQGAVPVGRKIGFTNPDMWALYGVREPMWGYVYAHTLVPLIGGRGSYPLSRFAEPRIEPEIVFHFHTAPPVGADLAAILACIDWVAHGFELVQSHFPGWKFQAADTIADGGLHGALLLGEPQAIEKLGPDLLASLARFSLTMSCHGALRESGLGANVLGHPLAAIAHLMAVLAQQPSSPPIQANELITTGTVTSAPLLLAGQTWRTELQGIALPGLSVAFTA